MDNNQNTDVYVKSAESAFSIMGGMILLLMASLIILPNDVTVNNLKKGSLIGIVMQYMIGFLFLYISTVMMKDEWITLLKKSTLLSAYKLSPSNNTIFILSTAIFSMLILFKLFLSYMPYLGYIFFGLFSLVYLKLMQKVSQTKSGMGKAIFIVVMIIILLVAMVILAFVYLTRDR